MDFVIFEVSWWFFVFVSVVFILVVIVGCSVGGVLFVGFVFGVMFYVFYFDWVG